MLLKIICFKQGCDRYNSFVSPNQIEIPICLCLWFFTIERYNTTKIKWQILHLQTDTRCKMDWFFWFQAFQLIHLAIRRNLAKYPLRRFTAI